MKSDGEAPKKVAPVLTEQELEQHVLTTKEALDRQPKRRVKLRVETDPKKPNYETVQINGYTYQIMKGPEVMVPEEVYNILERAGII